MEDWVKSPQFGSGCQLPVAYTTAWVGMIRDSKQINKPAFPQSVQWLRVNQLKDGSWGSKHTYFIYDRIVSTIGAVICLKQYNSEMDCKRIERGVEAITQSMKRLNTKFITDNKKTNGFELILSALIDMGLELEIDFSNEEFIKSLCKQKLKKSTKIREFDKFEQTFNTQKSWWFILEGQTDLYDRKSISNFVDKKTHLIGGSYSTTAFAVINDSSLTDCMRAIEAAVVDNDGGVADVWPMDTFDLAWSLNHFTMAGIDINQPLFNEHVNKLDKIWQISNGFVGGCSALPPDADTISSTISALISANKLSDSMTVLHSLMEFFRDNYFITFGAENPSLSVNINCLIALNQFRSNKAALDTSENVANWVKNKIIQDEFKFTDKWHYSKYYSMSRALFAFKFIDPEFCQTLYNLMIIQQNSDGGWGMDNMSTPEETAYVIIAICHWRRLDHNIENDNRIVKILKRSKNYFLNNSELYALWIHKALYCPHTIVKSLIFAANYALNKALSEKQL